MFFDALLCRYEVFPSAGEIVTRRDRPIGRLLVAAHCNGSVSLRIAMASSAVDLARSLW